MANIHIKELFGSDNITDLTEKVNFNFDQLILAGGGPEGPIGPTGNNGVAGPDGTRGSQWVAGFGATTINLPTDGVYRKNDFLLNDGGSFVGGATAQVWYYNSTTWVDTGINLKGLKGDQGPEGIGAIAILPGLLQGSSFVPNRTSDLSDLSPKIADYLDVIVPPNDKEDYDNGDVGFINAGVDFAAIGRGNNSLVLGRYATLFETGSTSPNTLKPPGTNATLADFPSSEADVPMLLVSQNDYKDPSNKDNTYANGISIGLTKSHPDASYGITDGMRGTGSAKYIKYSNISIENKHHDLRIASGSLSLLTLSATADETFFRLGNTIQRTGQLLDARSTKLFSGQYTNFKINNSFFVDLSDDNSVTSTNEFITNAQSTSIQNFKSYNSDVTSTDNDSRAKVAKTFIGTKNDTGGVGANELVFINGDSLTRDADGKTITKSIDPTTSGSKNTTFQERSMFDSNTRSFAFRIGQTTVKTGRMKGVNANGTPKIDPAFPDNKINITYQGQGYDTPFIQYSGIDLFNTYTNSINGGTYEGYAPYAVIPNDSTLEEALGYDIKDPIGFSNTQDYSGSRSMSRMGIYPGFFRKEKNGTTYTSGTAEERQAKFFDVAHRMMPTGSLDVFGTVRIREQETTDNGAKDGWIAVNKKDGILGFQEPAQASSTPTFSIIMFPEMASNKFSFYIESGEQFGASSVGDGKAYNYAPAKGSTSRSPFAAFPGKGSDELKDYYICNGAVLADSRDVIATGPFSKMKGMNVSAANGAIKIQNGVLIPTSGVTDYEYEPNPDFKGIDGQTHISSPQDPATAGTWSDYVSDFFNNMGSLRNSQGSWGCSVLAGELADSKFRIILPNYFGRVAKMQFPDSDSMIRAISGQTLPQDPGTSGQERDSGYIYHKANGKYNASWMMKGMFDSAGFPYLSGSQTPKMVMPKHRHDKGDYSIDGPNWDPFHEGTGAKPEQDQQTSKGAHGHKWDGQSESPSRVGGSTREDGKQTAFSYANQYEANKDIRVSGAHKHDNSAFLGKSGFTGDLAGNNPDDNDYDIDQYYITGTGDANATFVLAPHFAYDVYGTSGGGTYSNFSNWISYKKSSLVDSSGNAVNGGKADVSGQKFITAPFKGTIMAINLRGVRNPNRGNSVITDLHYIAGVPLCGQLSTAPIKADMSWYSDANADVSSTVFATSKVYVDGRFNLTTGAKYNEWWVDNFYEYGYKDMNRNDDTMHPYTYVDTGLTTNTSQLDYNTYLTTDSRKYKYDLYKTNITREDDFDL